MLYSWFTLWNPSVIISSQGTVLETINVKIQKCSHFLISLLLPFYSCCDVKLPPCRRKPGLPDLTLLCEPHHVWLEVLKIHGDSKVKATEVTGFHINLQKKHYIEEFVLSCCFKLSLFISCFVVLSAFIPYSIGLVTFYTSLVLLRVFHWIYLTSQCSYPCLLPLTPALLSSKKFKIGAYSLPKNFLGIVTTHCWLDIYEIKNIYIPLKAFFLLCLG